MYVSICFLLSMRFCLDKKKKKKKSSPQNSNLGPLKGYRPIRLQLILRDIGRYAYNSEGVSADTLKGSGENTALYTVIKVESVMASLWELGPVIFGPTEDFVSWLQNKGLGFLTNLLFMLWCCNAAWEEG